MKTTKESPGCMHDFARFICEETDVSYRYHRDYDTLFEAIRNNPSYNIRVVYRGEVYHYPHNHVIKGGLVILRAKRTMDDGYEFFAPDIKWDQIFSKRTRMANEMLDVNVYRSGKYKDSLGGGWYSKVDLYQYKGKYFANMECTCR